MIRYIFAIFLVISGVIVVSACKYQKGDIYTNTLAGDSLNYVIMTEGKGRNVSKKASKLKLEHEFKGNSCQIRYLSDSAILNSQRGILLGHYALPNIENDMLTGGFIGTFTSKQNVIFLIVSDQDFKQIFRKKIQ